MLLVLSLLVVLESVSSYPAGEDADESIATSRLPAAGRKHSKSIAKEGKTKSKKNHHNRHSSRG
jgi:hypothetical protein